MSETTATTIVRICSILELWYQFFTFLELLLKVGQDLSPQLLTLLSTDDTLVNHLLLILFGWRGHTLNLCVHDRLREARLIHLVVTVVAIADHIKHDIFTVFAPVLDGKATCLNHSNGVR